MSQADPQIPIFELLPAFEEETGVVFEPRPVQRAALDEHTPQGAGLRALATRLRALGRDKRLRRIGVVGCGAGEGATTVALGLARALARVPAERVLYLELDLRRPAADQALGLGTPAVGLGDFLRGTSDVPVLRRHESGFWSLSGGAAGQPVERLGPERLAGLLKAADRVFDFVVADCPPILPDADGLFLQEHLDGFVFVVRSRNQPVETVRRAARMLRPERVVGFVLNAQHDWLSR